MIKSDPFMQSTKNQQIKSATQSGSMTLGCIDSRFSGKIIMFDLS